MRNIKINASTCFMSKPPSCILELTVIPVLPKPKINLDFIVISSPGKILSILPDVFSPLNK